MTLAGGGGGDPTLFRSLFKLFVRFKTRFLNSLSSQGHSFKFLSILGHGFFSFVRSKAIKMRYRVHSRVSKMKFCLRFR